MVMAVGHAVRMEMEIESDVTDFIVPFRLSPARIGVSTGRLGELGIWKRGGEDERRTHKGQRPASD